MRGIEIPKLFMRFLDFHAVDSVDFGPTAHSIPL